MTHRTASSLLRTSSAAPIEPGISNQVVVSGREQREPEETDPVQKSTTKPETTPSQAAAADSTPPKQNARDLIRHFNRLGPSPTAPPATTTRTKAEVQSAESDPLDENSNREDIFRVCLEMLQPSAGAAAVLQLKSCEVVVGPASVRSDHSPRSGRRRTHRGHARWGRRVVGGGGGDHGDCLDSGMALLLYMAWQQQHGMLSWDDLSVVDLESTASLGVVGLGVTILSHGQTAAILTVTSSSTCAFDTMNRMERLRCNVDRNVHLWMPKRDPLGGDQKDGCRLQPIVSDMTWGQPVDAELLRDGVLLKRTRRELLRKAISGIRSRTEAVAVAAAVNLPVKKRRRVLVTGADICRRPSRFHSLLSTLVELDSRLHQIYSSSSSSTTELTVDVWLAFGAPTHEYIPKFWDMARKYNFSVQLLAMVDLCNDNDDDASLDESCDSGWSDIRRYPNAKITPMNVASECPTIDQPNETHVATAAATATIHQPQGGGVMIVQIRKLPYTFSI